MSSSVIGAQIRVVHKTAWKRPKTTVCKIPYHKVLFIDVNMCFDSAGRCGRFRGSLLDS